MRRSRLAFRQFVVFPFCTPTTLLRMVAPRHCYRYPLRAHGSIGPQRCHQVASNLSQYIVVAHDKIVSLWMSSSSFTYLLPLGRVKHKSYSLGRDRFWNCNASIIHANDIFLIQSQHARALFRVQSKHICTACCSRRSVTKISSCSAW